MQFFTRRLAPMLVVAGAFFVFAIAFLLCACSGGESSSGSTAPPTSTLALATDSTGSVTSSPSTSASATTQPADTTAPSVSSTSSSDGTASTSGQTTTSGPKSTTTTAANSATTTAPKPTTTTSTGPVALKLSGPSGTKELSMADLKAMSATSGYGGWKNDLSNITGPVSWTGVSLTSLVQLVGGGGSVTVVASDGYSQTLSSGQAAGQVTMFDPTSGETVSSINGSLRVIVAYAKDGAALNSSEGPLRLAFVSSAKDQVTPSKLWVRMVVELRVQ